MSLKDEPLIRFDEGGNRNRRSDRKEDITAPRSSFGFQAFVVLGWNKACRPVKAKVTIIDRGNRDEWNTRTTPRWRLMIAISYRVADISKLGRLPILQLPGSPPIDRQAARSCSIDHGLSQAFDRRACRVEVALRRRSSPVRCIYETSDEILLVKQQVRNL